MAFVEAMPTNLFVVSYKNYKIMLFMFSFRYCFWLSIQYTCTYLVIEFLLLMMLYYFTLYYKHALHWFIGIIIIINDHLLPTSVLKNMGTGNKEYTNGGLICNDDYTIMEAYIIAID